MSTTSESFGPPPAGAASGSLPERLRVFAYAVEPKAPVYRSIMRVFAQAKACYELRLRPSELHGRLPAAARHDLDIEGLETTLDQLVTWGNLRRIQDTARARNLQEFARRRSLYQLTSEGEAAQQAVERVEATLGRQGSLQQFMLSAVLDELKALAVDSGRSRPDPGALYSSLFGLFGKFDELVNSASVFMGNLNDAIDAGDLADESFRSYKAAVVVYLEHFISRLSELAPQIERAITEVESHDVGALVALASDALEAPTLGDGTSAAAALGDRWHGLRAWFVGAGSEPPTVELLRSAGLDAINRLLAVVERVNDKRYRRVTRSADLLQLARWFERSDDAAAHRLFGTAFGLVSARHMSLVRDDEDAVAGGSWWSAGPVEVPTYLRSHGRSTRSGGIGAVEDHSTTKRVLAERVRAERAQVDRAAARFVGRGPQQLSKLPALDGAEFALLLDLLGRALARGSLHQSVRRGFSADGRFEVHVTEPVDGERAVIDTPRGRFTGPDLAVEVIGVAPRAALVVG
ncbi:MAG: TIGR02677 family protein [Actinomycetota bacterium]